MNPKALTLGELYGEFNKATQEWMDGVLSSIMRRTCSGNKANIKKDHSVCIGAHKGVPEGRGCISTLNHKLALPEFYDIFIYFFKSN